MLLIPIPVVKHSTVLTASVEMCAPFRCKRCGLERVARVIGEGSVTVHAALAFLPAPAPTSSEYAAARRGASADARRVLALATCPECGARDEDQWNRFRAITWTIQGVLAVLAALVVAAAWNGEIRPPRSSSAWWGSRWSCSRAFCGGSRPTRPERG